MKENVPEAFQLQWGPVVVTGISMCRHPTRVFGRGLQWGPVVVTGIRLKELLSIKSSQAASMGSGRGDRNQVGRWNYDATVIGMLQWGPVVVTGIRARG